MNQQQATQLTKGERAAIYRRWKRWAKKIRTDVSSILVKRYVFREIQKMVRENPRIQVPSIFWTWIRQTYYGDITLSIRRHVDKNPRTISLYCLLSDIACHPDLLSRKMYVRGTKGFDRERMNKEFDSYAGKDRKHTSKTRVIADRDKLEKATRTTRAFADKRVAHWDRKGPRRVPTVKELEDCIEVLEALALKYAILILRDGGILMPAILYDWKRPFRVAWIPSSGRDK